MNIRISLLLPTRGRPALVERLFKSLIDHTAHLDRVEVIVYVDCDDIESHDISSEEISVRRIIGPRMSMGEYNMACYAAASGDIIILVNDDMVIRTDGWDDRVIGLDARITDKIYLAYGNDLFNKKRLCTFPILSRQTCDILGEPYPREYRGAFIDYHLFDIFKRLQYAGFDRIHYLDDVVFEHLHYRTGKAVFDDTYRARGRFADDGIFLSLIAARKDSSRLLLRALRGGRGEYGGQAATDKSWWRSDYEYAARMPKTLIEAISVFTRDMLLDLGLPLSWRTYLWVWFLGRYMAARGMLRPFVG